MKPQQTKYPTVKDKEIGKRKDKKDKKKYYIEWRYKTDPAIDKTVWWWDKDIPWDQWRPDYRSYLRPQDRDKALEVIRKRNDTWYREREYRAGEDV
jgi:hypothetical protein